MQSLTKIISCCSQLHAIVKGDCGIIGITENEAALTKQLLAVLKQLDFEWNMIIFIEKEGHRSPPWTFITLVKNVTAH